MNADHPAPMNPACRAAVVIPAHNESATISECLASIARARANLPSPNQIEVVVVDNASSDDTAMLVRAAAAGDAGLSLIREPRLGIGYARAAGARYALSRAARRTRADHADFWLLSTDADSSAPPGWLADWFAEWDRSSAVMIAGGSHFGNGFHERYPNAAQIFARSRLRLREIESWVGVVNVSAYNSAIERRGYAAAGPYPQPVRRSGLTAQVNLAGEDWLLSARAAALGLPIARTRNEPITISPRRFAHDPEAFLNGTAYEQSFEKVDEQIIGADIAPGDVDRHYAIASLRNTLHFIEKPILINPTVLEVPALAASLGDDLVEAIRAWMSTHATPDLFLEDDIFIADYLPTFHQEFGSTISARIFG